MHSTQQQEAGSEAQLADNMAVYVLAQLCSLILYGMQAGCHTGTPLT